MASVSDTASWCAKLSDMKPLYDRTQITRLLPQRAPMIEVDEFYGIDASGVAVAALEIRADNILCEGDCLSTEGVAEHMAQSAAARAGYLSLSRGEEIKLGFIGAVSGLSVSRLPRVGEVVTTSVEVLENVMNIALISVVSRIGDEVAATCRMKIYTEE